MNESIEEKILRFQQLLPYKHGEYGKKSWGHPLHSLCSYQGKLKPAIAHWLVKEFVPEGGSVLDPIGGVGTIPFEAALLGRRAVSNDKSPFASTIARAKMAPITLDTFEIVLRNIKNEYANIELDADDFLSAEFGLNSTVKDYYHQETLIEILKLRKVFLSTHLQDKTPEECFFWSCMLHILHGNRPYALSRNSHPITPFSPTGEFVYKNTFDKIREKAIRALAVELPKNFVVGEGLFGDFRDIDCEKYSNFDAVITSPPFYGMRFDRPNWLRLWFCGWNEYSFKNESLKFLERQQIANIEVYKDLFSMSHKSLKKDGILIVHLGKGGNKDMSEEFKNMISGDFALLGEALDCVEAISKHGIKDKGLTQAHNLLFFRAT